MKLLLAFITFCIALPTYSKTSAIVETSVTHYIVQPDNRLLISQTMRVKILEEEGYSSAIYKSYYNTFRKIKRVKYTLYDASGKQIKKLGKNDALDIQLNPSYEISDARLIILDPKYKNFPFTVEIEVEIEYNGFLDFPVWSPRNLPYTEVKDATLIFECPPDYLFRWKELNGGGKPKKEFGNPLKFIWSLENLPAVSKNQDYHTFSMDQPVVRIAPINFSLDNKPGNFSTWGEFGDWYIGINENRNKLTTETKSYLDEMRSKHISTAGLVTELYRYMQSRTRYISIQLGIGGFQTIPSDVVEKTGYGDCKALTNYMKAMLEYVQIPSNYILVNAGKEAEDVLADFPSNQFNHVFLGVPVQSDTILLECTSQISPASYIGTFTDDRNVLWIENKNSKIIRTPAYTPEETLKLNRCIVHLSVVGDARISLEIEQGGAYFDDANAYKSLSADIVERYNYHKFNYKDFSIQTFNFQFPETKAPILKLKYELAVKGLGRKASDKLIIPANVLPPVEHELELDLLNRKGQIRRGFTIEDHVEIRVPENFWVDILPEDVDESNEFGSMEFTIKGVEPGKIFIYRKVVMKKGLYMDDNFSRFYDYLKKIRSLEQAKLVLQSKT